MTVRKKKKEFAEFLNNIVTFETPNAKEAFATGKVTKEYLETLEEEQIDLLISPNAVKAYGIEEVTPERILKLGEDKLKNLLEVAGEAKSIEGILNSAKKESAKNRLKSLGKLALRTAGVVVAVAAVAMLTMVTGGWFIGVLVCGLVGAVVVEKALINNFNAEIEEYSKNFDQVEEIVTPFIVQDDPQKETDKWHDTAMSVIAAVTSPSPSADLNNPNATANERDKQLGD